MIFTDGASKGNPGPAGWGAVISRNGRVEELGAHVDRATNNQMELTAVIAALAHLEGEDAWKAPICVYTDSMYIKNGATEWIQQWIDRGWKRADGGPVQNKQRWKSLYNRMKTFDIDFKKVPAHSGIPGNVRADAIARRFAEEEDPDCFTGSLVDYNRIHEIDLRDTTTQLSFDTSAQNDTHDTQDSFYLSLVDDEIRKHASWESTKERVDGVSSARYQKVKDTEDARRVLIDWGVDPADISLEDV